jgi:hypothetical protein
MHAGVKHTRPIKVKNETRKVLRAMGRLTRESTTSGWRCASANIFPPANSMAERVDFGCVKKAPVPFGQRSELQVSGCHADQPLHFDSERGQQAPDVAVLSFIENDFNPTVLFSASEDARALCGKEFFGIANALGDSPQ